MLKEGVVWEALWEGPRTGAKSEWSSRERRLGDVTSRAVGHELSVIEKDGKENTRKQGGSI